MLENLQNAIRQNTAQTDLPEQVFVEAIEEALRAAARRVYGAEANISVEINLEEGDIRCYVPKKVVNIMRDFSTEIPIEQAVKLQEDVELGQMLKVEINPSEFGRIPAQLAKQILFQKIKQAEREKIYQEFEGREGEIVTGYVSVLSAVVSFWILNRQKLFYRHARYHVRKITNAANGCSV